MTWGNVMVGPVSFSPIVRWYAVRSQPAKEALAQLHLERQGFETCLPKIVAGPRARAPGGRAGRTPTTPLFANYLFVRAGDQPGDWRAINGTIGVARLVQFGDRPAPAPQGFVEGLIAHTGANGLLALDQKFPLGSRVQVVGGPLDGLFGELRNASVDGRVTLLMHVMSRAMDVVLAPGTLISAA